MSVTFSTLLGAKDFFVPWIVNMTNLTVQISPSIYSNDFNTNKVCIRVNCY